MSDIIAQFDPDGDTVLAIQCWNCELERTVGDPLDAAYLRDMHDDEHEMMITEVSPKSNA